MEVNSGSFCPGDSVELNAIFNNNYNYHWTSDPVDPNLNGNSPNPVVSPSVLTNYFVVIDHGTCILLDTEVVTPNAQATLVASDDVKACDSNPVTLSVLNSSGSIFDWSASPDFDPVL